MGWKCVGIDGKGYANAIYISEFHPHIPAGWILQKKRAAGRRRSRRPPPAARQPFFLKKPADWDVGMEFGDAGCVRISFAINSNPFSAHLIENKSNLIGIDAKSEKANHPQNEFSLLG